MMTKKLTMATGLFLALAVSAFAGFAAAHKQSSPQVTVKQTPYGKVTTTQHQGTKNGIHYQITTKTLDNKNATPKQKRALIQHIEQQQRAIEQQIQHEINYMNRQMQQLQELAQA